MLFAVFCDFNSLPGGNLVKQTSVCTSRWKGYRCPQPKSNRQIRRWGSALGYRPLHNRARHRKEPIHSTVSGWHPSHNHTDGWNTYVWTWESCCRSFAHLLRSFHQLIEQSFFKVWTGQKHIVVIEIIADWQEVFCPNIIHTDGREVELRSCHG